jgi:hypothetical protein
MIIIIKIRRNLSVNIFMEYGWIKLVKLVVDRY